MMHKHLQIFNQIHYIKLAFEELEKKGAPVPENN